MVLSESVGTLIGILDPGKNWIVIKTKAIWARVSRLEMSFWRLINMHGNLELCKICGCQLEGKP